MGAGSFGSDKYSREELVAEIAASMVMSNAGIEQPQTFENSVAYIKSWSRKLKEDMKAIVIASGQAQKAAEMITGRDTAREDIMAEIEALRAENARLKAA